MSATQKSRYLCLVLVAAVMASLSAPQARADEEDGEAGPSLVREDAHHLGASMGGMVGSHPATWATSLDYDYTYRKDSAKDDPSAFSEGNDDLKLSMNFGATTRDVGARRFLGGARIDGARGPLAMGFTAIDANSDRVQFLDSRIGPRIHFGQNGNSHVDLLVNPIGFQTSETTGQTAARTGVELQVHKEIVDGVSLDASGGLGLLWNTSDSGGSSTKLGAALTLTSLKVGETPVRVGVGLDYERNHYPERAELTGGDTDNHVVAKASGAFAF